MAPPANARRCSTTNRVTLASADATTASQQRRPAAIVRIVLSSTLTELNGVRAPHELTTNRALPGNGRSRLLTSDPALDVHDLQARRLSDGQLAIVGCHERCA